jgi:hypothetical protein
MEITDLDVTCRPQLNVSYIDHPDATQDTYVGVNGAGFANGPVHLWYDGVPGLGDSNGWQYGATLQATNNAINGWDESTLVVGAWNGCQEANLPGTVQIMAIDSAGNESNIDTVSTCRICGGC